MFKDLVFDLVVFQNNLFVDTFGSIFHDDLFSGFVTDEITGREEIDTGYGFLLFI